MSVAHIFNDISLTNPGLTRTK